MFHSIGDPRITKFASSAAHLMGKPLASSESCTWQSEHFTETLGVSQTHTRPSHGRRHQPRLLSWYGLFSRGSAWPGWLFYASTHFEPNNPTWRDLPALNAYVTRCQSVLQSGAPDNDVLLYWPLHDLWQRHPELFGLTIEGKWLEIEPVGATAQTLWERGYAYDFISDSKLRLAKVRGRAITMPGGAYRTVLIPPCHVMPLDTLKALLELARSGASILFQGGLPEDVPGLGDLEARRAEFKRVMGGLRFVPTGTPGMVRTGLGNGEILVGPDVSHLLNAAHVRREPICDQTGLMFLRRRSADGWSYFVVNQGKDAVDGWFALATPARSAILMDPMTGHTGVAAMQSAQPGAGEASAHVCLQIPPGGSVILRTLERRVVTGTVWRYTEPAGVPIPLSTEWSVRFLQGGPSLPKPFTFATLGSWTAQSDEEARRFAGTARYTLTFDAPTAGADSWLLDLGDIRESAQVRLNGKDVGTLLLAPWQVLLGSLKPQGNLLEVDVTNVAANRIRDMDRRGVPWRIFKEINFVNIDYKPFDASNWPIRDCGLLGPVRLIPMRRATPAAK